MKLIQSLLAVLLCVISFTASAQWQWIDNAGRKVFSDRPPSADVPEKNILKRPKGSQAATTTTSPAAAAPSAGAPVAGTAPKLGEGVDKGLLEKKKRADAEQVAKQKAEEDRVVKVKAENCARAQQAKAGLDTGLRQTRLNESGEREFLDDAARAAETRRVQSIIETDCK